MKKNFLNNKSILITGGTGSFGQRLVSKLIKNFNLKRIVIYSRDELKQFEMKNQYDKKQNEILRFFIGDVRDKDRLSLAFKNIDYVIHAAALKQVPSSEYNPFETIKTNILGAQNVIDAALKNNVKKVVALSTDKAAAPINLYGATKLASDKLFVSANNIKGKNDTVFSVVRYGNVLGSRGSLVPFLINCKKDFPITDPNMTRFNISLDESIDFVLFSIEIMIGGEIFVPKINSYNVLDVAKSIDEKRRIKIIGIRPGEKIHEEMITTNDAAFTLEFKKFFIIQPNSEYYSYNIKKFCSNSREFKYKRVKKNFSYNSKNNEKFLKIKELKNLIKKIK
tara:strand:- start:598 stop:1608 length:1011 start_codon:yes stop_codon:yes gene_type:complete